jgi:hypothetical protein
MFSLLVPSPLPSYITPPLSLYIYIYIERDREYYIFSLIFPGGGGGNIRENVKERERGVMDS